MENYILPDFCAGAVKTNERLICVRDRWVRVTESCSLNSCSISSIGHWDVAMKKRIPFFNSGHSLGEETGVCIV